MRTWLLLFTSAFYLALQLEAKPGLDDPLPSPQSHAELARAFLLKLPEKDIPYTRFLSFYPYEKEKILEKWTNGSNFWVNNLHFQPAITKMRQVPESKTLFTIDLRDYGWKIRAFSAVARREPYFREPFVNTATAEALRTAAGLEQDPVSLHAEVIVRGDWFFRETFESDRSPSYYDLLFAKQRFVTENVEGEKTAKFVDFPQDEKAFEGVFGVDKAREFIETTKIDPRHGAVVEGAEKGVSIVARQNRLIERITGFIGSYYKTYDVKETSGRRDFVETLNKDFLFDAGEILTDLPAGGLAALLVNNVGKIVETADNRFATDKSDITYDARVRTPGSCFICHESKYIMPENLVEDIVKSGIDIRFKDKSRSIGVRAFFLGWTKKLTNEQELFSKFLADTSGYKAGENARNLKAIRDEYDSPVDFEKVKRETGLSEARLNLLLAKSTKGRLAMLFVRKTIPRKTFEVDVYKEIMTLDNAKEIK